MVNAFCNFMACAATAVVLAIDSAGAQSALAQGMCDLPRSKTMSGKQRTRLAQTGRSVLDGGNAAIFGNPSELRVNTDGSPLSYHPFDPHGTGQLKQQFSAADPGTPARVLNRICNAKIWGFDANGPAYCQDDPVSDFKSRVERHYRIFEKIRDAGWSSIRMRLRNGSSYDNIDQSWERIKSAGVRPGNGILQFSGNILMMTADRKQPCIRQSGRYKGYFVNMTAMDHLLTNTPAVKDGSDPKLEQVGCFRPVKLDSEAIPSIVLPNVPASAFDNAKVGDIVIAHNAANDSWVLAIAGDEGNSDVMEGSIALNRMLLRGQDAGQSPDDYWGMIRAYTIGEKASIDIHYLILPGTAKHFKRNYGPEAVQRIARLGFEAWGRSKSTDPDLRLQTARQQFSACAQALRAEAKK